MDNNIFSKYFEIKAFYLMGSGVWLVLAFIALAAIFFAYGLIATILAIIVFFVIVRLVMAALVSHVNKQREEGKTFKFHNTDDFKL